ncbi:hypothetical protein D3C75_1124160 [compost metagenome]
MKIRARAAVLGITGHRDPVAFLAARVDHLGRRRSAGAMPQACQLDAADMLERQVGDIHIEHCSRR